MTASHWIQADGVRLHAETSGEGTPVLLLHGFTGSARSMDGVAEGLRDAHRVLGIDLVGHGRSEAPRDAGAYSLERCAAQVVAALDAFRIERAHLVGYSMGGRLALALCAWHAERVASATLVGASAGIGHACARAARRRADEALADAIERDGVPAFVDRWMQHPLFRTQRRLPAALRVAAREQRLANRARGLAGSLRGMGTGAQPPLRDRLDAVRVPVCLVAGAEDAKFAAIAEDLARRLRDGRVHLVAGAGHAAHIEQPETFLRVVRSFLAKIDARPENAKGDPRS